MEDFTFWALILTVSILLGTLLWWRSSHWILTQPPPRHNPPSLNKTVHTHTRTTCIGLTVTGLQVVVISDTHGAHRNLQIPDGDVLVHAGDFTRFGSEDDAIDFNGWLATLPHRTKIVVEGNHEFNAPWKQRTAQILSNANFLRNEALEVDGVRFFGKGFFWNMRSKNPYDDLIPKDTDVLIAHNPARGYVDGGKGCEESAALCARLHPRAYICGHIHTAKGITQGSGACATTMFVNGASVLGDHTAKEGAAQYSINGGPLVLNI